MTRPVILAVIVGGEMVVLALQAAADVVAQPRSDVGVIVLALIGSLPATLTILFAQWNRAKERRAQLVEEAKKQETRDRLQMEIKTDVNSNMTAMRADLKLGEEKITQMRLAAEAAVQAKQELALAEIQRRLDESMPRRRR